MRRHAAWSLAAAGLLAVSCGSDDGKSAADVVADRCIVRLHGKGGGGEPTAVDAAGIADVRPAGNAEGWGGRQWLYFPDDEYAEARTVVADAIDALQCDRMVLHGFSNGGAFAAKLLCRGETFDGRLVGVVIDDPVADASTDGCDPASGVPAVLYWTGALVDDAPAGTDCSTIDWTCEGTTIVGIDQYAARLGLDITPSPHAEHEWYADAPEPTAWLG